MRFVQLGSPRAQTPSPNRTSASASAPERSTLPLEIGKVMQCLTLTFPTEDPSELRRWAEDLCQGW